MHESPYQIALYWECRVLMVARRMSAKQLRTWHNDKRQFDGGGGT